MKRAIFLDEFLEATYKGRQLWVKRFGDGGWKTSVILWLRPQLWPVSCKTFSMRYFRWLFFEIDRPTKEANGKTPQLNTEFNS